MKVCPLAPIGRLWATPPLPYPPAHQHSFHTTSLIYGAVFGWTQMEPRDPSQPRALAAITDKVQLLRKMKLICHPQDTICIWLNMK